MEDTTEIDWSDAEQFTGDGHVTILKDTDEMTPNPNYVQTTEQSTFDLVTTTVNQYSNFIIILLLAIILIVLLVKRKQN